MQVNQGWHRDPENGDNGLNDNEKQRSRFETKHVSFQFLNFKFKNWIQILKFNSIRSALCRHLPKLMAIATLI